MPFDRPTLPALKERIRADLLTRMRADDVLRRSDAEVYAAVLAGTAHGLYGFAAWIARQIMPDTAEAEYLDRWATLWGVSRKPAAAATGSASFSSSTGAVIGAGTLLRAVDGVQYFVTADAIATAATVSAPIAAVTPGAAANRSAGSPLTLVSPVVGVQPSATASALVAGADAESDDDLRDRLLLRVQAPPAGGNASDYVGWALEVPGVTRAWVYPREQGIGTVVVRFVRDNDASPIPDAGEVADVQAHIDLLRPVTAQVTVQAPSAVPLAFSLSLFPDSASIRAAVEANLRDLIATACVPGGTLYVSQIREAISRAAGEDHHTLIAPAADVSAGTGQLTTFGSITYV